MTPNPLLTTDEVAEITRVPSETLRYWRYRGEGPRCFKLGRRVLYATSDLEAWMSEARETTHREPKVPA